MGWLNDTIGTRDSHAPPSATRRGRTVWRLAVPLLFPALAGAQSVRGVVVDQGDIPVPGVVVQLLDSTSHSAARALSNDRGEFRLAAPAAGTYRVTTLRIGYSPLTTPAFTLGRTDDVSKRLVLSGARVALDAAKIVEKTSCRAFADSTAATYAVWEQIRAALTATQLTAASRTIATTTVAYERTLNADGRRVRTQHSSIRSEYVRQPWLALAPDVLRRVGYVTTDAAGITTYNAPGLDMLLSDAFVQDHCFHLRAESGRVGMIFEPIPERRRTPEIRGTLWLNRASTQLTTLEYRYTNIPSEQADEARGDMSFARMKNGAWAISGWSIRMPALEVSQGPQGTRNPIPRVAEIHVTGGELALARIGADTIWKRAPLALAGTIIDSVSDRAIANARVSIAGTQLAATTDDKGRFSIDGVMPGEYTVDIGTPALDSVNARHQSAVTFTGMGEQFQLRVPTAAQIISLACGNAKLERPGIVLGSVVTRGDTTPPRGVKVVAEWSDVSVQGSSQGVGVNRQTRGLETHTDARGGFRLCGVPVTTDLALHAEANDASSPPIELRIPANNRFARAELTIDAHASRGAVLTGIVMIDSTKQPLVAAEVTLPQLGKTVLTNERGAFRITDIPAGDQPLVVRHVGYGALNATLTFAANQTLDRTIFLSHVVALDSVRVTAEKIDPVMRDFEDHRKLGLGRFITHAELEKVPNTRLATLLMGIPGLEILPGSHGQTYPRGTRGPACQPPIVDRACIKVPGAPLACYAQVYMDKTLMNPEKPTRPFDISSIYPDQIEAVEYYASAVQMPPEYLRITSGRLMSPCGVIVIHTRR